MFKLMKNKKGFTLVEVIVVLVILAILAAIMIPSMTGWIDKAKQKSVLVEARSALLAAQTLASENYAKNITTAPSSADIMALAGLKTGSATATIDATGTVSKLVYVGAAYTVTYENGAWSDPVKK